MIRITTPLLLSIATSLVVLSSCEEESFLTDSQPPLVVEGWIESGKPPIVMVTHSVDLSADSINFDNIVEKWCRVSIFDNGERHLLSGRMNDDYTPSFIFTTSKLRGITGHTYRLLIETETDTIEGSSIILDPPVISSVTPVKAEESDSLFYLNVKIENIDPDKHYKIFSRTHSAESRFYGSFLGTFSGDEYNADKGIDVTRGIHTFYEGQEFNHYYTLGETVSLKVCTLEKKLFDFWKAYDNNISLSGNLFFTFSSNCPHTIDGAFGYWGAYGMCERTVKIK